MITRDSSEQGLPVSNSVTNFLKLTYVSLLLIILFRIELQCDLYYLNTLGVSDQIKRQVVSLAANLLLHRYIYFDLNSERIHSLNAGTHSKHIHFKMVAIK